MIVDLIDGSPLKAATTALVLAASLIFAVSRRPRAPRVTYAAIALVSAAAALVVYRVVGPGL